MTTLRSAIDPIQALLAAARAAGLLVIHTREGHRPDLADAPPAKLARGGLSVGIGDVGPMGRVLIRGEYGHDIIPELAPLAGEPVIGKSGKGVFYETDLHLILQNRGIKTLLVCGVTTRCVSTPPCARPTTGATSAWFRQVASALTSRSSGESLWR
jgi:nicotinamidase-related amidase